MSLQTGCLLLPGRHISKNWLLLIIKPNKKNAKMLTKYNRNLISTILMNDNSKQKLIIKTIIKNISI